MIAAGLITAATGAKWLTATKIALTTAQIAVNAAKKEKSGGFIKMSKEKIFEILAKLGEKAASYALENPDKIVKGAKNSFFASKSKKQQISDLETENDALREENISLTNRLAKAEEIISEVETASEELRKKVEDLSREKEELESTLIEKEYQIIDYEAVHKRDLIIEIALAAAVAVVTALVFIF